MMPRMSIHRKTPLLLEDSSGETHMKSDELASGVDSWEGGIPLGSEAPKVHFRSPYVVVGRLAHTLCLVDVVEEDARPTQGVVYEVESLAHVLLRNLNASGLRQTLVL